MASNNIIRTWDSIAVAVRTLNIPVHEINSVLQNKTDSAGGFKWEYAIGGVGVNGSTVEGGNQIEDEDDDFEDEVWLLFIYFIYIYMLVFLYRVWCMYYLYTLYKCSISIVIIDILYVMYYSYFIQ